MSQTTGNDQSKFPEMLGKTPNPCLGYTCDIYCIYDYNNNIYIYRYRYRYTYIYSFVAFTAQMQLDHKHCHWHIATDMVENLLRYRYESSCLVWVWDLLAKCMMWVPVWADHPDEGVVFLGGWNMLKPPACIVRSVLGGSSHLVLDTYPFLDGISHFGDLLTSVMNHLMHKSGWSSQLYIKGS